MQAMKDLLNNQFQNYQLYTNSSKQAHALFFSGGISYYLHKNYLVSGNINFSRLYTGAGVNTNEVAPFNTPQWASNLSFSNANVGRGIGFKINWHWQDAFDWYGTFNGNRPGRIKAFSLVDAQVNKKLSDILQLKAGANNLFNHRIAQTYGSPQLGAIYYVSFTWDTGKLAKQRSN
jgi:outer membrane receptor for ferrienterochelin and colicin